MFRVTLPRCGYRFGDFEINPFTRELRKSDRKLSVGPKTFDFILYLISHRERVVSRDELFQALWPDQTVTEGVLAQCVWTARRALGDSGGRQSVIKTLNGVGYHFIHDDVQEVTPQRTGQPLKAGFDTIPSSIGSEAIHAPPSSGRLVGSAQVGDGYASAASYYNGLAAFAAKDWNAAVDHFLAAIEVWHFSGHRQSALFARVACARALVHRDAAGDREMARELATYCLEETRQLGLRRLNEQMQELLTSIQAK